MDHDSRDIPAVSVILPTHNRPELLAEAIDSLFRQTRSDWEAIIVDDASTPPANLPNDPRLRLVRQEKAQGGAASKKNGIEHASAPVLAFLDDDDLYAPDYLERALGVLDRYDRLDVLFMGVTYFGEGKTYGQNNNDTAVNKIIQIAKGKPIERDVLLFDEELVDALLKSVPMGFQRPIVRKSAFTRIGTYRPECLLWDCDWALRAAIHGHAAYVVDGLYLQRAEGQGYSSRVNRRIEHMQSSIEIKQRLLHDTQNGMYPCHLAEKIRPATAQAWFDLAWHHYQQGNRRQALQAWWHSELTEFSMARTKLLPRLLLPTRQ